MQYLLLLILGFAGVHLFKMIRLYLVLMEHKLPLWQFVLLYLRTTLVNLIIPFKLGELYRIEETARLTGIWQVGVLSVVVDRYFDILALFIWLLPLGFLPGAQFSLCLPLFGILILLGGLIYMAIPGSFAYLNRFLIRRRASARSMAALQGLGIIKGWYDYAARLVRGRAFLITFTSALGWGLEIATLHALAGYLKVSFAMRDFGRYIDSVFLGKDFLPVKDIYVGLSVTAFAVMTLAGYLLLLSVKITGRKDRKG